MWGWLRKQVANFRAWRRGEFEPPGAGDMFRLRGRDYTLTQFDEAAERERVAAERVKDSIRSGHALHDRRELIRTVCAALLTSKLLDTPQFQGSIQPGAQEPLAWDDSRADPLADVVAMRKCIESASGLVPSTVVLTSLHRDYVLERFNVDLCDESVRAEIGSELGLKVVLVKAE